MEEAVEQVLSYKKYKKKGNDFPAGISLTRILQERKVAGSGNCTRDQFVHLTKLGNNLLNKDNTTTLLLQVFRP